MNIQYYILGLTILCMLVDAWIYRKTRKILARTDVALMYIRRGSRHSKAAFEALKAGNEAEFQRHSDACFECDKLAEEVMKS